MSLELKNNLRSSGFTFDYSELFTKNTTLNVLAWDASTNAIKVSDLKLTELLNGVGGGSDGNGAPVNLADYVTLDTEQIVSGSKTFTDGKLFVDISSSVEKANASNSGLNVLAYSISNGRVQPSNLATAALPTKSSQNVFTGINIFEHKKLLLGVSSTPAPTLDTDNVAFVVHDTTDGSLQRSAIDVKSLAGLHIPNTFDENAVILGQTTVDDARTEHRQVVTYDTSTGALRKNALVVKDIVTTGASHTFTGKNTFQEGTLVMAPQNHGDDAAGTPGLGMVAFNTASGTLRRSAIDPTTLALVNRTSKFETNMLQISQSTKDATNQKERNLVVWDTSLSNSGTVRLSAISSLDLMLRNQDQFVDGKKTFADGTLLLQKAASGSEDSIITNRNLVVFDPASGLIRRSNVAREHLVLNSTNNTFSASAIFNGPTALNGETIFAENKLLFSATASVDDVSHAAMGINKNVVIYDTTTGALRKSATPLTSLCTQTDLSKCAKIDGDTVFTGQNSFVNNTTFQNGRLYLQQNNQDDKETPGLKLVVFNEDGNIRQSSVPTTDIAMRADLNDFATRTGPNTFNGSTTFAFSTTFKDSTLILNQSMDDPLDEPARNFIVFNTDNNIIRRSAIKTSDFVTKQSLNAADNVFGLVKRDQDNNFAGTNRFSAGQLQVAQSVNDDLLTPERNLVIFDTSNGGIRRSAIATSDLITYNRLASELNSWGAAHLPESADLSMYASKIGTNIFSGSNTFQENTLKLQPQSLGDDAALAENRCFVFFDTATGSVRRSALAPSSLALKTTSASRIEANVFEAPNTFQSTMVLTSSESEPATTTANRGVLTYDTISGQVHKSSLDPASLVTQTDLADAIAQVSSLSRDVTLPEEMTLLASDNTFSGTNAFTSEVTVSSLKFVPNTPPESVNAANLGLLVYNADGYVRKSKLLTMAFPTLSGNNAFMGINSFDTGCIKLNAALTGDDAAATDGRRFVVFDANNGRVRRSAISTKDFAPVSVLEEVASLRATVAELSAQVAALMAKNE